MTIENDLKEFIHAVVNNVWFSAEDGWYWCDGYIKDEHAQSLINNGWSVSCSYNLGLIDDKGGTENNIKYDNEFLDGTFTHLALVNNPRYERANIVLNSKTSYVENWNEQDHPRNNDGTFAVKSDFSKKYKSFAELEQNYSEYFVEPPEDYLVDNEEDALKDLEITIDNPKVILTPIGARLITTESINHIYTRADKTRYKSINKMIKTLETPLIINRYNNKEYFFKVFKKNNYENNISIVSPEDENFEIITNIPTTRLNWFYKQMIIGETIYDIKKTATDTNQPVNNIITNNEENFKPMEIEIDNDKWITVHPHGEDSKGQHVLLKDGETVKEAFEDKKEDKNPLKKEDSEKIQKAIEMYKKYGDKYSKIIDILEKELQSREPKKSKEEIKKEKEIKIQEDSTVIKHYLEKIRPGLHYNYNNNSNRPYEIKYREGKRYNLKDITTSSDKVSDILKYLKPQTNDENILKSLDEKINLYEEKEAKNTQQLKADNSTAEQQFTQAFCEALGEVICNCLK